MKNTITQEMTLLEALAQLFPESSKNTLRSWIERGRITINGKTGQRASQIVKKDEKISLGNRTQFIEEKIEVLFEDEHLVVINKPEGLLSVATDFQKWTTAHAILKRRFHAGRVYPVHRLDRETSGVMLFTYTEASRDAFKKLFLSHDIEREYFAVVQGLIQEEKGTWQSYLREDEVYNVSSVSDPEQGQLAITHYEVLKKKRSTTAIRLILETGRKNQIRVHCKEAGHPVVGDKKYCAEADLVGRLCLHARKLGFVHPITRKRLCFETPLPQELLKFTQG
ncbi:MAG: RluA family pseudouridine synthase [Chlamydiota bacterium]